MKTFLIAALTADGFIAKDPTHSPLEWRSQGDRRLFIGKTKEAGVVVMGANTARTSKRPLPGRRNIIYAHSKDELQHWAAYGEWEVTQKDPQELLEQLAREGAETVAVCGGAQIYTAFMERGLVDTLYLTIEPWIFGQGMHLFQRDLNLQLELVSAKNLEPNTLLLEYNVVK